MTLLVAEVTPVQFLESLSQLGQLELARVRDQDKPTPDLGVLDHVRDGRSEQYYFRGWVIDEFLALEISIYCTSREIRLSCWLTKYWQRHTLHKTIYSIID